MSRFLAVLSILLAVVASTSAADTLHLRYGVDIAIPKGWTIEGFLAAGDGTETQLTVTEQEALVQAAQYEIGCGIAINVLPGEASQAEIAGYTDEQVAGLGQMLVDAQRSGLAVPGLEITGSAAERTETAGKLAVRFDLKMQPPQGRARHLGKYYFYTQSRTVIVTLLWTNGQEAECRSQHAEIMATLRVE